LTVGQQARVESLSGQVAVTETRVAKATAWRERRLVFESLSLRDVIDEFNRYNDPPLAIEDPGLEQLPISGVFRANDRESFVQFLSQMQLAEADVRDDGTIVLRPVSGR
jgi:transmembrane sensor